MAAHREAVRRDIPGGGGWAGLGKGSEKLLFLFLPGRNVAFLLHCGNLLPRSLDHTGGKKIYSD